MSITTVQTTQEPLLSNVELLNKEIFDLESEITDLERQNAQSPALLRFLRKWLVFGPVKKLEWVRFKLRLDQKELRSLK